MIVSRSLEAFCRTARQGGTSRHAVTIGNFDGVHTGHRELILVTRRRAAEAGIPAVALTFDPHPARVLRGTLPFDILTPLARKLELLEAAGLDATLVLPFTPALAAMPATHFVRQVLIAGMGVKHLVTGYNFALGNNRDGDLPALEVLGAAHDLAVTRVPPVTVTGEPVSSTRIRDHIRSGDVYGAISLLGRLHTVDGIVVTGKQRGRTLGFPTANLCADETLLPPPGAYATWVSFAENSAPPLPAMTSVGTNPTFGENSLTLETHILDFSGDLYGTSLRLHFVRHLRGQAVFTGPDALKKQLFRDAAAARTALEKIAGNEA